MAGSDSSAETGQNVIIGGLFVQLTFFGGSLFRAIEFIEGNDGYLMRSEVWVFVFDGLLMAIVLVWFNWFHHSEIGLLLRGVEPVANGLQLVNIGKRWKKQRMVSDDLTDP